MERERPAPVEHKQKGRAQQRYAPIPEAVEKAGSVVVDAALTVHRELGPGLLESAYQRCLAYELRERGLHVECELPLPLRYKGVKLDAGYRLDMLVENVVVVENKAMEALQPLHTAQVLTYLRLGEFRLGYLINWNVTRIKQGIHRLVQ